MVTDVYTLESVFLVEWENKARNPVGDIYDKLLLTTHQHLHSDQFLLLISMSLGNNLVRKLIGDLNLWYISTERILK